MVDWSPACWQQYPCLQTLPYPDQHHLNTAIDKLSALPPLVTVGEIESLKSAIAKAGRGEAFILQGGDCAESFADCEPEIITNKLKIMLQMSVILIHCLKKPIIRIGRIAGQYTKPRSSETETINGLTLSAYRGDLFNRVEFDEQSRIPNPDYLLQGYTCAATTLNYIRALVNGGFASLHHPENWDLSFVSHASKADEYQRIIHQITQSIEFLETIDGLNRHQIDKIDFYTSHEALNLYYEQALTRNIKGEYYNLSTHLPWIGMRTTDLSGAHIAYAQGIQNPIGIKLGPHATSDWLIKLINNLNPDRIEGKLLLISRLGHEMVQNTLPDLIKAAQSTDIPVTWACDPMHGNTQLTSSGIKTRDFDLVLSELVQTHETHQQHQSYLGGVHFELTGENVTECIGGARGLSEDDLHIDYRSLVDPRLNYEQSLEMALKLGQVFKK